MRVFHEVTPNLRADLYFIPSLILLLDAIALVFRVDEISNPPAGELKQGGVSSVPVKGIEHLSLLLNSDTRAFSPS